MKINSSEQLNELFTALAKAQGEMPVVNKNKTNPFFKSSYADITEMVKTTRPALSKNGLSVLYPTVIEGDNAFMVCRLNHSSGQWIEGSMKISPQKTDIQSLGSYLSYLERYMYKCMTGCVTTDEDDDGEMAMPEVRTVIPSTYKISDSEVAHLERKLIGYSDVKERLLNVCKVNNINDITVSQYKTLLPKLDDMISSIDKGTR